RTGTGSFGLLPSHAPLGPALLQRAEEHLARQHVVRLGELATAVGADRETADRALFHLCRQGKAIFDVERREYRHRQMFETPIDEEKLFPPDPRKEPARALPPRGRVPPAAGHVREKKAL